MFPTKIAESVNPSTAVHLGWAEEDDARRASPSKMWPRSDMVPTRVVRGWAKNRVLTPKMDTEFNVFSALRRTTTWIRSPRSLGQETARTRSLECAKHRFGPRGPTPTSCADPRPNSVFSIDSVDELVGTTYRTGQGQPLHLGWAEEDDARRASPLRGGWPGQTDSAIFVGNNVADENRGIGLTASNSKYSHGRPPR